MPPLSVPPTGLTIHHELSDSTAPSSKHPPQVIRLDLAADNSRDILRSLRNNEQVRLRFAKKPAIQYGKKSLLLSHGSDSFPADLFTLPDTDGGMLYFSGKLSHTLEVQHAQEAVEKSDLALANLENTLKSIQEQKVSNETSFVRNREEMKDLNRKGKDSRASPLFQGQASAIRKDRFLTGVTRSTPSSPFLGASFSPRAGPTSAPLLSSAVPGRDKIRLDAIRIPMVHLLAAQPMTPKAIAQTLRASLEDCDRVIQKIARDCEKAPGKKELKEKSYRELDVWKFPYQSQEVRQKAIDNAVHAFDRMRIERTNNLWQLLLAKDERGKGKHLSKLSFDKPLPSQVPIKQDSLSSTDGKDGKKSSSSEQERGRLPAKSQNSKVRAISHEPLQKKKVSEKESQSKQHVRKEAIKQLKDIFHERGQTKQKTANSQRKYKSPEVIEESDEEAEGVKKAPAKPMAPAGRERAPSNLTHARPHSPKPQDASTASHSTGKSFHKSKLSESSSADSMVGDKRSDVSSTDATKLQSRPRAESSLSRVSPRVPTDRSPQKPSPLASSPPTNSSDLENSSSSKESSRSSATSSPPSSTDMPQKKPKNFSPVIAEKRDTPVRGRSPAKRKPEDSGPLPPSKRHQVNGVHTKLVSIDVTDINQRPAAKRHPSDSDSLSSPEKPTQRMEEVVDKSKRFQLYYKRYKDLHEKVSASKDKQELDELWKMHQRLSELKKEIWDDWRKLGKPEKIQI